MPPIGDLLAQITGEPSPTQSAHPSSPPKRKADDQIRKTVDKIQRTQVPAAGSPRPIAQASRPATVDTSMAKLKLAQNHQKQPLSRPSTATTSFKNGQPTPPPTNDAPKAPPKKGSFAEIMARGKAAQSTLGQVGKIQHKRIEKQPSKREREDAKAQKASKLQKNLAPDSKFSKMGQNPVRNGQSTGKDGGKKRPEPLPEKKVKKAALATTGYTGTSRPKPGGGSSRPSASSASSRYDRGPDRDRHRGDRYGARYTYASEDEEDEEEEDEPDYESDLSDMEAAAFEVDEEEEEAARIARREDALALAEENRLKREKEEKRRRLAAMAKSRR
ncbi:hypothetical protein ONS95_009817 [Cadophora gregata]|uniref:uncharacterized protein n=1 Tax=Cadophora gregata TaxID=51156 RepID=UPI0026DBD871|nr:uncharacterized protein ONS95_009817 [Cadophora gregata]KAK0121526.1 hypothetical protein ONS95_009817 [Cadophora gregata]KAK0127002.1 hypothetical protein ONS96_006562 [Cadophora gregata f. sp. sojae]